MTSHRFIPADPVSDRDALLCLNIEYIRWVFAGIEASFGALPPELAGIAVPDYVAGALHKVCQDRPPHGTFYLIEVDGELAGMCGLRRLGDGCVEIKRVYVRPQYRGLGLGAAAMRRLLQDASEFGYQYAYLDSGPFMQSAQHLYEAMGFADCDAYAGIEVPAVLHPAWRFMRRSV